MANATELDKARLDDMDSQLRRLRDELSQVKYKMQTASIMDEGAVEEDKETANRDKLEKVPLTERLDIYFEDNKLLNKSPNIVRTPLSYEPVACKPLFFDLALNHVELPSLEDKIDSKKTAGNQQAGVVKGLFKGFFGLK